MESYIWLDALFRINNVRSLFTKYTRSFWRQNNCCTFTRMLSGNNYIILLVCQLSKLRQLNDKLHRVTSSEKTYIFIRPFDFSH